MEKKSVAMVPNLGSSEALIEIQVRLSSAEREQTGPG